MVHRGEIYLADFSRSVGSEQSGIRPALVVQNDVGNAYSRTTIVVPLTSKPKNDIGTHVVLRPDDCGIIKDSVVLCEQLRVVDKERLVKKVGEVKSMQKIEDINKKIMISLGLGGI